MTSATKTPPIVLAIFGASSSTAREVYRDIEARVCEAFPGHEVVWAYLSRRIVLKQRELGVILPTLPESLASLKQAGHSEAVVQPLLVVPGEEYAAVKATVCDGMVLSIGDALLTSAADMTAAISAISPNVVPGVPNVLICHGNQKHPEYNEPLLRLKQMAEAAFNNMIVASVEGEPGTEPLIKARDLAKAQDTVAFIPFMIAAGEHVTNDVMGSKADSWRNVIGARQVTCAKPLGNNSEIIDIFINHIKVAMQTLTMKSHHD